MQKKIAFYVYDPFKSIDENGCILIALGFALKIGARCSLHVRDPSWRRDDKDPTERDHETN